LQFWASWAFAKLARPFRLKTFWFCCANATRKVTSSALTFLYVVGKPLRGRGVK
jgi:hypothetical protein